MHTFADRLYRLHRRLSHRRSCSTQLLMQFPTEMDIGGGRTRHDVTQMKWKRPANASARKKIRRKKSFVWKWAPPLVQRPTFMMMFHNMCAWVCVTPTHRIRRRQQQTHTHKTIFIRNSFRNKYGDVATTLITFSSSISFTLPATDLILSRTHSATCSVLQFIHFRNLATTTTTTSTTTTTTNDDDNASRLLGIALWIQKYFSPFLLRSLCVHAGSLDGAELVEENRRATIAAVCIQKYAVEVNIKVISLALRFQRAEKQDHEKWNGIWRLRAISFFLSFLFSGET